MSSAPQNLAWANGRSRLTVTALILSPSEASSSLNRFVCTAQTGVSRLGTTLMMEGLPFKSSSVNVLDTRLGVVQSKGGASRTDGKIVTFERHRISLERDDS